MSGIFSNYRCLHELLFPDTVKAVTARESGAMSEPEFRDFIRWRDGLTRLDMDSSSFNCYYADVLARDFEDARLVFVIRDCFSWLDSFLNMVLFLGPMTVDWMVGYVRRFVGPAYERELSDRPDDLQAALPGMVDAGFRYWSTTNTFVLRHLPADRSLILRTRELSRSAPALASFLAIPEESLTLDQSHLNQAEGKYHCLQMVDRQVVYYAFERHCSDLMREFFPTVTLAGFLRDDRRA
ncbi:MAG: hypothetical protein ACR2GA_01505 [Chloroflexota bacterium]